MGYVNVVCACHKVRSVGSSLVPKVAFQRTMYRRMSEGSADTVSLTHDSITRLEGIGFECSMKGTKHTPWDVRYAELIEFKVQSTEPQTTFEARHSQGARACFVNRKSTI